MNIKNNPAVRLLVPFLAAYRMQIGLALLGLVVSAAMTLVMGQGIRLIIDRGIATESVSQLRQFIGFFIVLILIQGAGTFLRHYWISWLGERVVADIRKKTFQHLIWMSPGFFHSHRGSDIQSRLTVDTTVLQSIIGSSISLVLRNLMMIIGGIAFLLYTNLKLSLVVLICLPIPLIPLYFLGRKIKQLSKRGQQEIGHVGGALDEILSQIRIVQAYLQELGSVKKFEKLVETSFKTARARIIVRDTLFVTILAVQLTVIAGVMYIGGKDVISGALSPGELAAFIFYGFLVGTATVSGSHWFADLQRAAGSSQRIIELLDAKPEIVSGIHEDNAFHSLKFESVDFVYESRADITVLKKIGFKLESGKNYALVGPSGAGKTTIFDLMLRFYDPTAGAIFMNGIPLEKWSLPSLRSLFAWVPQSPMLFTESLADNVKFGREKPDQEVMKALELANLKTFAESLPEGIHSNIGEQGKALSEGQKQRLSIARALLTDAPIFLFDEATSSLDAENEKAIQEAISALPESKTTVTIAHRLATVRNADCIFMLEEGQITAQGNHEHLIETNPTYASFARNQLLS